MRGPNSSEGPWAERVNPKTEKNVNGWHKYEQRGHEKGPSIAIDWKAGGNSLHH